MPRQRLRILYQGRVQGVGFRFTCQRLSSSYPVVGYVRNLPDGGVELVADGDAVAVHGFLTAVESELGDNVRNASVSTEIFPEVPDDEFMIRY